MKKDLKYFTTILKESAEELTLLYVEDDADVRDSIASILQKFFKRVTLAEDGKEALEKYEKESFDIILTDISMPHMNGVEMASRIKEKNCEQPIIVLSAHNEGDYLIDLINIGVDGFLLKPIQTEMLVKILGQSCRAIHDRRLLVVYQEKMEESYIEMMRQRDELQKRLDAQIESENRSIGLVEVVKEVVKKEDVPIQESDLDFFTKEFEAISAAEFIANYPTDLDIYGDKLLNIGEKIDLVVNSFVREPSEEGATELSNYFLQYSEVISSIPEFINLTYAINRLSEVFAQIDCTKDISGYYDLILAISQELEKWRESIFELQNADDIHYLDSSLIADCVMLESFVAGEDANGGDNEGDIEFF